MAAESNFRRLCAILAADVVGYSRLMGADEDGTLAALTAHRREFIDPAIAGHAGRIVKTTGDGLLVEFASVVDAVKCAVDIQRGMAERNHAVPWDRRLVFRIGLNLGDVIVQNGDLYGDGVNVAARLEALAEPGGICLSASAQEQVRDKIAGLRFEDLGEQRVKNIARPVRTYRIAHGSAGPPSSSGPALPSWPSIAVLPLDNLSADPEQEYFADGLTEDLITDLSKTAGLLVIARNSTFTYKGRSVSVAQVGRELGARYVVEGSVRKIDNRVRITAQLIDAATSTHVWADRYDRDLTDTFAVQDEVTREIVAALRLRLTPAGEPRTLPANNHRTWSGASNQIEPGPLRLWRKVKDLMSSEFGRGCEGVMPSRDETRRQSRRGGFSPPAMWMLLAALASDGTPYPVRIGTGS